MRENYHVAGIDLSDFTQQWLHDRLRNPDGAGLLNLAETEKDGTFYGRAYLTSGLAPLVVDTEGTIEERLLCGVMFAYSPDGYEPWKGCEAYLDRAFQHMSNIGEVEAARRIVLEANKGALEPRVPIRRLVNPTAPDDPAKDAAHERTMAHIRQRNYRVARALDPDVDTDLL